MGCFIVDYYGWAMGNAGTIQLVWIRVRGNHIWVTFRLVAMKPSGAVVLQGANFIQETYMFDFKLFLENIRQNGFVL